MKKTIVGYDADGINVGDRVIQMGTAKGRGTVVERSLTLGLELAGVDWDDCLLTDFVSVGQLTKMERA